MASPPKAPAFQLYPRDLLADTSGMSNESFGAYVRLMLHAWDPPLASDGTKPQVGFFPNEPDLLAEKSCAGPSWEGIARTVLRHFRATDDGRFLVQKRLVEERKKQRERSKSMSENGKKGGRPTKQNESREEADGKPQLSRTEADGNQGGGGTEAESTSASAFAFALVGSKEPTLLAPPSPSAPAGAGEAGSEVTGADQPTVKVAAQVRKARAPKVKPAAAPMPWTVEAMLDLFRQHSGGQVVVDPFDRAMATPLTGVIRSASEAGVTLDDVQLAAEYAAVWVPTLQSAEPLGIPYLATGGKLSALVGKARSWRDRGRQLAVSNVPRPDFGRSREPPRQAPPMFVQAPQADVPDDPLERRRIRELARSQAQEAS